MSRDMITQNESGNKLPDWQLGEKSYLFYQPEWMLVRLRAGKAYLNFGRTPAGTVVFDKPGECGKVCRCTVITTLVKE